MSQAPELSQATEKTALGEWITFALLAAFAAALLIFALLAHLDDPLYPTDLRAFYTVGTMLKHDLRCNVYTESAQQAIKNSLWGPWTERENYTHPPFESLLYWGLSYLPFRAAYVAWDLLNLVLLGWALYLLKPYAAHLDTGSRLTLALAVLCPLISTLREGQNLILLVLSCVGAFVCLKNRREVAAGCSLGAGLFRFQFVLPLLLIFAALKKWKIVLGIVLVGAILGLVSLALVGWAGIRHYIALLSALSTSTAFPALVPAMPNVRGFINVLFAGRLGPHYLTLLETAGLFVLLSWPILEWRRRGWDPDGKAFDLLFSLSIVVCVMTSHHLLINGLLLLIVPALLLLDYAAAAYPSGLRRWRLAAPLLLLFPMTIFLNLEVENRLGFLLPVILWLAFAISEEIPKAQKQTGGGERGRS